jgi:aspartokinase
MTGIEQSGERTQIVRRPGVTSIVVYTKTGSADLSEVFGALAESQISVMVMQLGEGCASFVVDSSLREPARVALERLGKEFRLSDNRTILSIRTNNMREASGIMYRIALALRRAEAKVDLIGDSYSSVSCLIDDSTVERAYQELCAEFPQDGEGGEAE